MENPATTEDGQDQTIEDGLPSEEEVTAFTMPTILSKEYEIYK